MVVDNENIGSRKVVIKNEFRRVNPATYDNIINSIYYCHVKNTGINNNIITEIEKTN